MSNQPTQKWDLSQDGISLGVLELQAADQPWLNCTFYPSDSFDKHKHLFERELQLLDNEEMEEWEVAYDDIDALNLELCPVDGDDKISDFILHIKDNQAWFRY